MTTRKMIPLIYKEAPRVEIGRHDDPSPSPSPQLLLDPPSDTKYLFDQHSDTKSFSTADNSNLDNGASYHGE